MWKTGKDDVKKYRAATVLCFNQFPDHGWTEDQRSPHKSGQWRLYSCPADPNFARMIIIRRSCILFPKTPFSSTLTLKMWATSIQENRNKPTTANQAQMVPIENQSSISDRIRLPISSSSGFACPTEQPAETDLAPCQALCTKQELNITLCAQEN